MRSSGPAPRSVYPSAQRQRDAWIERPAPRVVGLAFLQVDDTKAQVEIPHLEYQGFTFPAALAGHEAEEKPPGERDGRAGHQLRVFGWVLLPLPAWLNALLSLCESQPAISPTRT